ncbi:nuclear speckle splicing regulatory protein 1 [Harmonia axyridis]|uniref:nuclear speckle splicing regulatory protein 1 n=1 Tax=Harmonia axyridis TaxID=115357 RepID=UPI001E2758AE|nr:nuclear speckle splicing regulatory protein 1 [Harmonia axyridis]
MSKKYGLITSGQNKMVVQPPGKRAAIFDEDSDSDESDSSKPIFQKPILQKKIEIEREKALEEDPTVYQYDEIYDDMAKQKNECKLSKKWVDKKPKYISNLIKAAERRKRENERRLERQVQKEREAEGDEFKDKESFVTPSYLKKLEEMKVLEEQEKREEYLETIGDVKKQGNLDGFYRHVYDQKVNFDGTEFEKNEDGENSVERNVSSKDEESLHNEVTRKKSAKRHYRKREKSDSEDDNQHKKKEHLPSNLDADSDFSIDSSDSEKEKLEEVEYKETMIKDEEALEKKESSKTEEEINLVKPKELKIKEIQEIIEKPVQKKAKIDVTQKRTVGEAYEAARRRYQERSAVRNSA